MVNGYVRSGKISSVTGKEELVRERPADAGKGTGVIFPNQKVCRQRPTAVRREWIEQDSTLL